MIPKTIHYCWVGGDPLPELAEKCIESWKKYCPDYKITEWNETNYDFTKNRYMKEAFEAGKWGFVPDYARLDIIYSYGGIYLDTDVEIIKPIDDLLAYKAFMGMERPGRVALGLGFGAEPGNALIREMMDSYEGRSFYNPNGTFDTTASPTIQSKFLVKKGLAAKDILQQIDHAVILPSEYLCPQSPYTGKTEITGNTYSIHHYMASWMSPLDRLIFDLNRKFDKSRKTGAFLERLTTAPFRAVRTVRKKGVKGIFRKGIEKVRKEG